MSSTASREGDLAARRILALGRLLAVLTVTATSSIELVTLPAWAVWTLGLVVTPWAAWLWISEESTFSEVRFLSGVSSDIVLITALMVLLPDHADDIVVFTIPLMGAVTYVRGLRGGLSLVAAMTVARCIVQIVAPDTPVNLAEQLATGATALLVIGLIHRAVHVQRQGVVSLQRASKKSDALLAHSAEAIVLTDSTGRILQSNPAAERILSHEEDQGLVGHGCAERLGLSLEGGPQLDCAATCALAILSAGDTAGIEVWRDVGEERQPLLASATAITNAQGHREFVHSLRDITKLKQAEDAKNMFLATASHELKTPLTVIRGFTQVLQKTVTDPSSQVALQAIESRSRELAAIVDRLLLSSRIDAGKLDIKIVDVDVAALIRERLQNVSSSLGRVVNLEIDDELMAKAASDGLITALDHLIDNACKYSPSGGPVTVRASNVPDGVRIDVCDTGIGMTPEQADSCFEKFWQAEATDVRRFGGTGIGLYIVKSLVHAMGGQVSVTSRLGIGSTFHILLPTIDAPPPAPPASPTQAEDEIVPDTGVDQFLKHLGLETGVS